MRNSELLKNQNQFSQEIENILQALRIQAEQKNNFVKTLKEFKRDLENIKAADTVSKNLKDLFVKILQKEILLLRKSINCTKRLLRNSIH